MNRARFAVGMTQVTVGAFIGALQVATRAASIAGNVPEDSRAPNRRIRKGKSESVREGFSCFKLREKYRVSVQLPGLDRYRPSFPLSPRPALCPSVNFDSSSSCLLYTSPSPR